MQIFGLQNRAVWLGAALLASLPIGAAAAPCAGHGGAAGCDKASASTLCTDGTVDRGFPCSKRPAQHPHTPKTRELKFKKSTDKGQILSPGQTPPQTSFEKSK